MRTKRLVIVRIGVLLFLSIIGLSIAGHELPACDRQTESAKAEVFALSPDQIVDIYDGDTFKVDLPSQHPLFGADLSIRVFGIDTPEIKGTSDELWQMQRRGR